MFLWVCDFFIYWVMWSQWSHMHMHVRHSPLSLSSRWSSHHLLAVRVSASSSHLPALSSRTSLTILSASKCFSSLNRLVCRTFVRFDPSWRKPCSQSGFPISCFVSFCCFFPSPIIYSFFLFVNNACLTFIINTIKGALLNEPNWRSVGFYRTRKLPLAVRVQCLKDNIFRCR